ncbi:MAG TPA: hypothetical protein DCX03_08200 [Bacteroidales bacterium]|nr:hypothetical protein [Bacteroidales bacterium]
MTTKDYSDPKTVQKIIEKCRRLQEEFNSEINLDYLEKSIEILNKAIENTPKDEPSRENYIDERNQLHNRYPDLQKWLSGPRNKYKLDIKYIYSCLNENHERLDRYIIIKALNELNRERERAIQDFLNSHKEIFSDQFDYALAGFEGIRDYQYFPEQDHWQHWVGIFLNSQGYPKWANDEAFKIKNAPSLDEDRKIYLPVRPKNKNKDPHKLQVQKPNNGDSSYLMPINVSVWCWDDEAEDSRGYFEFSNQLMGKIVSLNELIQTKDVKNLDIKSFHFLIDYLYINGDVCEKIKNSEGSIEEYGYTHSGVPTVIDKKQVPSADWGELRRLAGDRGEKIFGTIEITQTGFVNLRLVFNNHPYSSSFEFEYWDSNPNAYEIHSNLPTNTFLAMFPDLDEDIR